MDKQADSRKTSHMHPYHYSLIHHSLGVPKSMMKPPLFKLDDDYLEEGHQQAIGGITGTRIIRGGKSRGPAADTLVTESLLLRLTECESLSEIRVLSLRNQQLSECLKTLAQCENLTVAYLQGNFISEKDMSYLQSF